MRLSARPALALAVALALAFTPADPQEEERLAADIAFARRLARDWRFIDLAEEVLDEVESQAPIGERWSLAEPLALARCDVYTAGAESARDPARRHELFGRALASHADFTTTYPNSTSVGEARLAQVELAHAYARSLVLEHEELSAATRARIDELLTQALATGAELLEDLDRPELTALEERARAQLLLDRGRMLFVLARVADDGTFFAGEAERALAELAFEYGETSAWGLRAHLELAELAAHRGDFPRAAAFHDFVLDTLFPRAGGGWEDICRAELDAMWLLASMGLPGLLAAHANAGAPEEACAWALHFETQRRAFDFELHPVHGRAAVLAVAETLGDAGGWIGGERALAWFATHDELESAGFRKAREQRRAVDVAFELARLVSQGGGSLRLRAQELADELASRSGVELGPRALLELADGRVRAGDHAGAIAAYRRALRALDAADADARAELGPALCLAPYAGLARSYDELGLVLEAALAYAEGAELAPPDSEERAAAARAFHRRAARLARESGNDPELVRLGERAEELLRGKDVGIDLRRAEELYHAGDYEEARAAFLAIADGEEEELKARVWAAVCLCGLDRHEDARRELDACLESLEGSGPSEAHALAVYFRGLAEHRLAEEGRVDASRERVAELLDDYHGRFPSQTSFGAGALHLVLTSWLAAGRIDDAERVFSALIEAFPDARTTGHAAFELYRFHEAAGGEQPSAANLRRRAERLAIANASGALSTAQEFARLREESRLWLSVEEWERARGVLAELVERYGEARAREVEAFVLPDLGHALLELRRVREAFDVLDPLVPAPGDDTDPRKPRARTVSDWCRAVAGWVEGSGASVVEQPGVGDAAQLEHATRWLTVLADGLDPWTCEWYEAKFRLAHAFYRWGVLDSGRRGAARRQIALLQTELGDAFEGDPALGIAGMAEACGGDDRLPRRFLWLLGKE